jgi:starch phosphorylase
MGDGQNHGGEPLRQEMKRGLQPANTDGGYIYSGTVSADRPAAEYTARVIPRFAGITVPLEEEHILWQK